MKADDAKRIKLEAEQARADQERYLQQLAKQRKKLVAHARLAKKKSLEEFNGSLLLLQIDLLIIKKSIVEAIIEGRDFISFNRSLLTSIYQQVCSVNELGAQLQKKHIFLPPILSPYNSDKGLGIFNPEVFTNKYEQEINRIRVEISNAEEIDYDESLSKIVYEALDKYDPYDNRAIDSVDESIIKDFQEKISNGYDLNHDELTVVVSILEGDLKTFYNNQKEHRLNESINRDSLERNYRYIKEKFHFFTKLSGSADLVLCWGTDVLWSKLFKTFPFKQAAIIEGSFTSSNPSSVDICVNLKLLNWASDLATYGFYDEFSSFIALCAQNGFGSCSVKVTENGLTFSQSRIRKALTFIEPIPLSNSIEIFDYWKEFFGLLDYKYEAGNMPNSFKIRWD